MWYIYLHIAGLTRALLGGAFERPPPSGFSRIAKKRRRAAPPGFHPPYPPSFPQLLWKFRPKAMRGQVTRSGQVTNYKITFPSRHGYNVSGKVMKLSEYDEVISAYKNVYLGFLISVTSGQVIFATSPLQVNGQKINSVIFTLAQAFLSGTISYRTVVDTSSKKLHYLPLQRSFEVTRGHQPSFANNFWSKRDRDVGLVSVRSSWPGESSDMQYDPFRSSRDLGLTRPEVKLWPWPLKVILYMIRRALTRQTRWYQIRRSIFKIKDFIVENRFGKFWNFDPNIDLSQKMTEMISKWFFASFRTLPFVFLYGDQEPRSWGGRSNAPPPPSRRWKIQKPSRARVNLRPGGGGGHFAPPPPAVFRG